MELQSDSGASDPNSVWGILGGLGNTAANVIGAVTNNRTKTATVSGPSTTQPTWLKPVLIGGGVLVGLIVLLAVIKD